MCRFCRGVTSIESIKTDDKAKKKSGWLLDDDDDINEFFEDAFTDSTETVNLFIDSKKKHLEVWLCKKGNKDKLLYSFKIDNCPICGSRISYYTSGRYSWSN